MPHIFIEVPESRKISKEAATLVYKSIGEQDDLFVYNYAIFNTPASVLTPIGQLWRQDIQMEPTGFNQYLVSVPYGPRKRETGSVHFTFDTTGGTATIKAAKEHIKTYDSTGPVSGVHHKGSINVTSDGNVEGAEIVIPALKLTATFRHPAGVVDDAYVKNLAGITGSTNDAKFRSYASGELLFIGATGSHGTDAETEISYHFIASQNADGLTIGDITDINKGGHQYLWVEFAHQAQNGRAAVQPKRIHIERLYEAVSFPAYFGWS